jgi:hypothetical protein
VFSGKRNRFLHFQEKEIEVFGHFQEKEMAYCRQN